MKTPSHDHTQTALRRECIAPLLLLLAVFSLAFTGQSVALEEEIHARYKQPRGKKITLQIVIPSPPPAAVIVTQSIPPGTVIEASSPAHNSYDSLTGTIKWLLTNVKPGRLKIKMDLDQPIRKKGEIHGEIIFQDKSANPIAFSTIDLQEKTKKKAIEGC